MYSHLKSISLVCALILTFGCGGGGGDDSGTIPPNPTADPPPIAEAPCDLSYPDSVLLIQAGGDVSGFSPSVDCGIPDAYSISPELPTGMTLEPDTGVISGSPSDEIYFDTHTITATNDIGSAELKWSSRFGRFLNLQPSHILAPIQAWTDQAHFQSVLV